MADLVRDAPTVTETSHTTAPAATTTSAQPGIELVRSGVLADHNTTTVGKALEGTFQNSKWTTFETPKGATIVQFDATAKIGDLWKGGFIPSTPDDVREKAEECRTPDMKEALRSLDVAGKTQEFLALRNAHDAQRIRLTYRHHPC